LQVIEMLPQLVKLKGAALDLLFPQWCIGCGAEGDLLCRSCRLSLPAIVPPICPKCGKPQPGGILCSGCVAWPADIDGFRSPYCFEGTIRQAVHQLKYKNLKALAKPLAVLVYNYWQNNPFPGEVLVPVPLHPKRLKERGYNQAALLAGELGKLSGLPVVDNCLTRDQFSLPQARTSSVIERRKNVARSFSCLNTHLKNKHIILIDDVATSGATLNACAAALKSSGAISVWGMTLAREI
jgi:ComF family protein